MDLLSTALVLLAQAANTVAPPGPAPTKPSAFGPEFFFALAIFLLASIFFIQRPQRRAQEERAKQVKEGFKKGEKVVSAGGIHGVVARANKARDTVFVTVAKGVEMEFNQTSLVRAPQEEKKSEDGEKDGKDKEKA